MTGERWSWGGGKETTVSLSQYVGAVLRIDRWCRFTRRVRSVALWLLTGVVLVGCDRFREEQWPYPILDSKFAARSLADVYWLDNRRVIFEGWEGGKPKTVEESEQLALGIFIWDVEANRIEPYVVPAYHLCYADGYIAYYPGKRRINPPQRMVGEMGKEVLVEAPPPRGDRIWNKFDCRISERPPEMAGRAWIPLRREHGYLERGPQKNAGDPNLIVPRYVRKIMSVELPFTKQDARLPLYSHYSNNYLFSENIDYERWRSDGCAHLWEMSPEGEVEVYCFPFIDIKYPFWPIDRTRNGLIIQSHSVGSYRPRESGIYLYRDGGYERLNAGWTTGHGISPNGCRIAFYDSPSTYAQWVGTPETFSLKMIDLCKAKRVER